MMGYGGSCGKHNATLPKLTKIASNARVLSREVLVAGIAVKTVDQRGRDSGVGNSDTGCPDTLVLYNYRVLRGQQALETQQRTTARGHVPRSW